MPRVLELLSSRRLRCLGPVSAAVLALAGSAEAADRSISVRDVAGDANGINDQGENLVANVRSPAG